MQALLALNLLRAVPKDLECKCPQSGRQIFMYRLHNNLM